MIKLNPCLVFFLIDALLPERTDRTAPLVAGAEERRRNSLQLGMLPRRRTDLIKFSKDFYYVIAALNKNTKEPLASLEAKVNFRLAFERYELF